MDSKIVSDADPWHPLSQINLISSNNYSIRLHKQKSHVNNPSSTRDDMDLHSKIKAVLQLRVNCCFNYEPILRV